MRKNDYEWGDFYDDNGEWLSKRPPKKNGALKLWQKLLWQTGAALLLFGCCYGLRATETMLGDMAAQAADYSVNYNISFGELRQTAEPYLSRFAEVEIFEGVQAVTARVISPVPSLERPAEWIAGEFDGQQRSYTITGGGDVKSLANGRVLAVDAAADNGQLSISYGHDTEAAYGGLEEIYVQVGERVRAGQTLAASRQLGTADGSFALQLNINGRSVDAESVFNGR